MMRSGLTPRLGLAVWLAAVGLTGAEPELRLITLDPAHFHAAQLHTAPMPGFSRDAWIYSPVGKDLLGHLNFISNLKGRSPAPDHWRYHIYAGNDFLSRMLQDKPGDVVVLSGRNANAIGYIQQSLQAGLHVLADKPWIIEAANFQKLEAALETAEKKGLIAYDCMSQRFEIAYLLQREFVNDPAIFGDAIQGSQQQPAVEMDSAHFLLKRFNGVVNLRPAAYFDIRQQGEALADVGTHVVDLAHWTLFPGQPIDYRREIKLLKARRWPTLMTEQEFSKVTGERAFPDYLKPDVKEGKLHYFANNSVHYTIRGHHVKLAVSWGFESPSGANDTIQAIYRGSRSQVMVRQSQQERYQFEVYVTPMESQREAVASALAQKLRKLSSRYPGLTFKETEGVLQIVIPPSLRRPDIEYFLLIAERFAGFVRHPGTLPDWEKSNMLAKYWVTTQGVELARKEGRSAF